MSGVTSTRKIIHIDMDCFYAAIEERDHPELCGKPVAVGGLSLERSVLCTCNYIAREYGLHSAMPTSQAFKLCPELILRPVNMASYKQVSAQIRTIFAEFTDQIEPLSLDEAFLDVSETKEYYNSATWIAQAIKQRICTELNLTASAGVAPNKFLAKIASDWQKPNGLFVITPQQVPDFIAKLPVNKLFGVGKVTAKKLNSLGFYACADLQTVSQVQLMEQLGGKLGQLLFDLCRGVDSRPVNSERQAKSISVETTFSIDQYQLVELQASLLELYQRLQIRLRSKQSPAIKQQFIKIKFNDFTAISVSRSADNMSLELFNELLQEGYQRQQKPIRLLGLGVQLALIEEELQLELGF